ncbi:MAG TPA: hypothetical protein VFS57_06045, partial [Gemmatimonadaceae bacterium]|nr:hypothetical protein [Gemmatimonadaceae bacterium]
MSVSQSRSVSHANSSRVTDMHSHYLALVAISLGAFACTHLSTPTTARFTGATSADITEADLHHRLFLIADDSMMGRESGSEGDFQTAA